MYVVPLSHILGKPPLIPAGDYVTITHSMHDSKEACYSLGECYWRGEPCSDSQLLLFEK
jgi:hypothetical protein